MRYWLIKRGDCSPDTLNPVRLLKRPLGKDVSGGEWVSCSLFTLKTQAVNTLSAHDERPGAVPVLIGDLESGEGLVHGLRVADNHIDRITAMFLAARLFV